MFLLLASPITLIATAFLWRQPLILVLILFIVSAYILLYKQHKLKYIIFFTGFILGPLSEIFVMHFGAWNYTEPHFLNIPIWLPFLWGNAGLFFYFLTEQYKLKLDKS